MLILKAPTTSAANDNFIYQSWQTIQMKYQSLFSVKNNIKNIKILECRLLQILLDALRVKNDESNY